ncbi:SapC family protein [Parvularcula oceani]|uniref:SapC family protein n=1 Tax=Parvularcula oceani TaxID=1247963 RepID=UPI00068BC40F|nr:SapC family protein [Parvularcula oceani]
MSQTPPAANGPQIQGQMFLFRNPQLLTREKHGNLGVSRPERPFAFAEQIRAVPLTVSEVASAMKHFPIIFSDLENPQPLAVLGLIDEQNIFVNDAGEWDENVYVPGYLRRYPFALATDRESDPQNPRMAIIVDEAYEGIQAGGDLPFFDGDQPSDAMKQAMEYCQQYERDRMITQNFAKTLAGYDLLAEQVAQFTPEGGQAQPFAKYNGVEEKRLNELSDEKFLELRKSNILPILHAQLMSMGNWRALMDRRARRFNLTGEAVLKPLPKA